MFATRHAVVKHCGTAEIRSKSDRNADLPMATCVTMQARSSELRAPQAERPHHSQRAAGAPSLKGAVSESPGPAGGLAPRASSVERGQVRSGNTPGRSGLRCIGCARNFQPTLRLNLYCEAVMDTTVV
jgi:hypothetical protein